MFTRILLTPVLTLFLVAGSLSAQEVKPQLLPDSEISIEGTSNIRDWHANVTTIHAELILDGFQVGDLQNLKPEHFKKMSLRLPVESINSGTRGLTNNIHDYLKKDRHPVIRFELDRITEIVTNGNSITILADGVVNAAGKNHPVAMRVHAAKNSEGVIVFSGSQDLKMTDFDIKPPRALMGTIRAVDEFKVNYNIKFRI